MNSLNVVQNSNVEGWGDIKYRSFPHKINISHNFFEVDKNCDFNICSIIEPPEIIGEVSAYDLNKFDLVLTWREDILSSCDKGNLFTFGTTWITDPEFDKENLISFLTSSKAMTEKHKMRKSVHIMLQQITNSTMSIRSIMSPPRIEKKEELLNPSMFSVVIENGYHKNYFTEKLVDCFMTKTIPIYHGCPNIKEFFNEKGIITFNNEKELRGIVESLTPEDYDSYKVFAEENYKLAQSHKDYFDNIYSYIENYFYGQP